MRPIVLLPLFADAYRSPTSLFGQGSLSVYPPQPTSHRSYDVRRDNVDDGHGGRVQNEQQQQQQQSTPRQPKETLPTCTCPQPSGTVVVVLLKLCFVVLVSACGLVRTGQPASHPPTQLHGFVLVVVVVQKRRHQKRKTHSAGITLTLHKIIATTKYMPCHTGTWETSANYLHTLYMYRYRYLPTYRPSSSKK